MSHFVVGCVLLILMVFCFFFFIATPTTSIYTLSLHDALPIFVIPQRATFEILDKRYVWVVGEDHVAHQRPITIEHELEDIYVIKSGLGVKDKIVLEGGRQVRDGEKVEYEFQKPQEALTHQKYHAE